MLRKNRDDIAAEADRESGEVFVLERNERLSRSMLWKLQRAFFHQAGIEAWRTSTVPHYVTNNPALAHAYAEVALGFLRDRLALKPAGASAEPFTLIELGAGAGRFAYLFLKAFDDLRARSSLAEIPFRYVMTDFTETNIAFWRSHEALRPFVERSLLDFAVFDAEHDHEIRLQCAQTTLERASLRAPMVIANYVFDGISQDAFSFRGGELHECLVSLSSNTPVDDRADPGLIGHLTATYEHRPASFDYYEEPAFNDILRAYAGSVNGATVLFPSAALRCLRRLAELAGGTLLLLSGDRGEVHADAVGEPEHLGMAIHGSFSLGVNYHAIAEYILGAGGQVMTASHRHTHLNVSAFVLGEHPTAWAETRLAYHEVFERGGPDDFFTLRRSLQGQAESLDVHPILALLRWSRWDPRVLRDSLEGLWKHVSEACETTRREIRRTISKVWENYYHLGEEFDLPFELGLLLYGLGAEDEAIRMFRASARLYRDEAKTQWNIGLCHYGLGQVEEALASFREAARLDPAFKPQGSLQIKERS